MTKHYGDIIRGITSFSLPMSDTLLAMGDYMSLLLNSPLIRFYRNWENSETGYGT